jgi:hypothetical protein
MIAGPYIPVARLGGGNLKLMVMAMMNLLASAVLSFMRSLSPEVTAPLMGG